MKLATGALLIALAVTGAISWLLPRITQPPDRFAVAMALMVSDRADDAVHLLDHPDWRGVAQYRAGRYRRALAELYINETVPNLYNMGNSYARLHEWKAAKSAFRKALSLDPDHLDARHNLALVIEAEALEKALIDAQRTTKTMGHWRDGTQDTDPDQTLDGTERTEPGARADGVVRPSPEDGTTTGDGAVPGRSGTGQASADAKAGIADGDALDQAPDDLVGTSGTAPVRTESAQAAEILLRRIRDNPERVLRARLKAIDRMRREQEGPCTGC